MLEPVIFTAPPAIILSDERSRLIKLPAELYGLFCSEPLLLLDPGEACCGLLFAAFVVEDGFAVDVVLILFLDLFLPKASTLSSALLVI